MNLQVDLLKKAERRYQGIVSMKVIALGSISVLAGISILVFSLAGISKMTLRSNLERARHEWERLSPQAAVVRNNQAAIAANGKTLAELEEWSHAGRLSMFGILRAVQHEIPAQMAVENLYAGLEQASDKDPSYYTLRFSGRARGELTAVEAKRQLNANAEVRGFCSEVKLVSSQRESGENWIFALEGRRQAGGSK
ncbi:MAG TPA: hypothetical protein PLD51_00780 [Pontiellaceae bacterium]|nr:hypothetical protein [Pontiellaceae bacterium]HPR82366.1 hypothetical protein [Pontiellaceae bacterium]